MTTIEDELARFDIYHERDAKTANDYRHTLWQYGRCIGRFDAHEAVQLLNNLRYGVDEPE